MSEATRAMDIDDDRPKEECGVFGVVAPGREVSRLSFYALHALQHRGQESAGIAVSDEGQVTVQRDLGLVSAVFDEPSLRGLTGGAAIGHVRYSTTGANKWDNAQPVTHTRGGGIVALGHNGNLTNTGALRTEMETAGVDLRASTDSEIIAAMLAIEEGSLLAAACSVMPRLVGAYSVVAMSGSELVAFRDPHGVRPLVVGRLDGDGWCVASETCALDQIGAEFVRDVLPGRGRAPHRRAASRAARPCPPRAAASACSSTSTSPGPTARWTARRCGSRARRWAGQLALQSPAEADLVVGLPDSGTPAAIGYAHESGIPYAEAVVRNRYVGRSFIQPDQTLRQHGIRLKFNPLPAVIAGKRLVVVDDSIVRGNTTRQIVAMLLDAGAVEVHMRISSPPILWPCFYGIDMADRSELVAAGRTVDEIAELTGADSLAYLSLDALQRALGRPAGRFCRACFTGEYPIPIPDSSLKMRFEPAAPAPAPV